MKKNRQPLTGAIPEVFSETPTEVMQDENDAIQSLASPDMEALLKSPKLPDIYSELDVDVRGKVLSKKTYYSSLSRFTPYLIKNLLFISNSAYSTPRDRIQASKILLDKIMPSLEAQHIQLDGDNVQGLVIVKADKAKDG